MWCPIAGLWVLEDEKCGGELDPLLPCRTSLGFRSGDGCQASGPNGFLCEPPWHAVVVLSVVVGKLTEADRGIQSHVSDGLGLIGPKA